MMPDLGLALSVALFVVVGTYVVVWSIRHGRARTCSLCGTVRYSATELEDHVARIHWRSNR